MSSPTSVDLSYKDSARRVYYDIEVLSDVFSIVFMTRGHLTLTLLNDERYNEVTDEQITQAYTEWMHEHRGDLETVCGPDPVFDLRRYTTGQPMNGLRSDLDTVLSCGSLWDTGEQFTEYAGWNSKSYDLSIMCGVRSMFTRNMVDPAQIRAFSDALVTYDGKPWELWSHIETTTGLIRAKSIQTRINLALYGDGHIDEALLARIVESDDTGEESLYPPGLKKEEARFGMDIVIDENVADADYDGMSGQELIDMLTYNAADVLATALVSKNRVIVGQLTSRDAVRRLYPYTSAHATPLEKAVKYAPAARDETAAHIASLVIVGPNRTKPVDYRAVSFEFPTPSGKRDLLDMMHETEEYMHPLMYQFFDHFRGKDTSSAHDNWNVKRTQPITHSARINIPYYRDGSPTNTYIRVSTGGAHGSVMSTLSGYSEDMVEQWVRSDVGAADHEKPTLDLRDVIHVDWSSFYPTMSSKMGLYVTPDGEDRYTAMIQKRLEIKSKLPKIKETWTAEDYALNEEQDGLKFVLNSATGAGNMHRKYALLPLDNKTLSMRLCGNLHIWCLCQRMTQAGGFIVSTNTDGFYLVGLSVERVQEVIDGYVETYGMPVAPEIVDRFINRDTSSRIEYQGTYRAEVAGKLTHGKAITYQDSSIGKNVPYPLAAANAVLRYMDDPDWLTNPYDRERLAGIVHEIFEESQTAEPWFHVHAGSKARRLTLNGVPQGKVNRVVLTKTGEELGSESASELTKVQALELVDAWVSSPRAETVREMLAETGMRPVREIEDGSEVVTYSKDEVTKEIEQSSDLSLYRLTKDRDMHLKLAVKTPRGTLYPLKVWKPTKLTGYPSTTGRLLNSRESLTSFDLSEIDEGAYVAWAEQFLDRWKVTADLPEIGMVSGDDTVIPKTASKRMTKAGAAFAVIEELYENMPGGTQ